MTYELGSVRVEAPGADACGVATPCGNSFRLFKMCALGGAVCVICMRLCEIELTFFKKLSWRQSNLKVQPLNIFHESANIPLILRYLLSNPNFKIR